MLFWRSLPGFWRAPCILGVGRSEMSGIFGLIFLCILSHHLALSSLFNRPQFAIFIVLSLGYLPQFSFHCSDDMYVTAYIMVPAYIFISSISCISSRFGNYIR